MIKMKKNNIYKLLLLLFITTVLQSCFEDETTYDSNKFDEVVVDTTGMPEVNILQFETLKIEPNIQTEADPSALTYTWKVNAEVRDTTMTIIGVEKDLEYEVVLPISKPGESYNLCLIVTDNVNEINYITRWSLTVKNALGQGLVVADSKDGSKTDLSLIMGEKITKEYDYDETKIHYNIYSTFNNDACIDGVVKKMLQRNIYGVMSLLAITDNSILRITTEDYTLFTKDDGMFYLDYGTYDPGNIYAFNQNDIYVENGSLFCTWLGVSDEFNVPKDNPQYFPDIMAVNHFLYPKCALTFYDEAAGKFGYVPKLTSSQVNLFEESLDTEFNPVNVPNKENLEAAVSTNSDFIHVLKDKTTNNVEMYIFNQGVTTYGEPGYGVPVPEKRIDLSSAPEISSASNFVICDDQNVIYYTAGNNLYSIVYSSSTPSISLRYASDCEITTLQMFNEVNYPIQYYDENWSLIPFISTNNNHLIMSTYDGNEGKVLIMPIDNLGIGTINQDGIEEIGGFGKISAITPQL